MTTDPIADAFTSLGYLDDAVKRCAYDCDCQVGGVDAMSIDTDWLRHHITQIRRGLLASRPEGSPVTAQPTRDQLRALADATTEGPWMHDRDQNDGWMVVFGGNEHPHGYNIIGSNEYLEPEDAAFIAAARNALPQLLDQLDQAEARIADTLALCDEWAAMGTRSMNIGAVRRALDGDA